MEPLVIHYVFSLKIRGSLVIHYGFGNSGGICSTVRVATVQYEDRFQIPVYHIPVLYSTCTVYIQFRWRLYLYYTGTGTAALTSTRTTVVWPQYLCSQQIQCRYTALALYIQVRYLYLYCTSRHPTVYGYQYSSSDSYTKIRYIRTVLVPCHLATFAFIIQKLS